MAEDGGYLKCYRKQFKPLEYGGDIWWNESRRFSRWEAWWYLIQKAQWRNHSKCLEGYIVHLKRGETEPLSLSRLASEWGWNSTKPVRSFLEQAKSINRIRKGQSTPFGHTYIIVNYDTYQSKGHGRVTAGARQGHGRGTIEKKEKKGKKENTDSSELEIQAPEPPSVLTFENLCNGSPRTWHLSPEKLSEWEDLYPSMDVLAECKKARQWLRDNPTKRKTARGMTRFLGNWLSRAQNSGRYLRRDGAPEDSGQRTGIWSQTLT